MPTVSRYKRTERNRGKYRNYPILNTLFTVVPIICKVLLLIFVVIITMLYEIERSPRLTGKWTY